jgi:putative membrane protein
LLTTPDAVTLDEIIPYLPHFQAILNTLAAFFLAAGYYFIRAQNRNAHRNCMITALLISTVFMVSYLSYHAKVGYMPFAGQGIIRPFYFTILASHVILAAVIVPMVLVTVIYAIKGNFDRHPRVARWTLPLWFYVSVSGVLIYIMGFHIYTPDT